MTTTSWSTATVHSEATGYRLTSRRTAGSLLLGPPRRVRGGDGGDAARDASSPVEGRVQVR